MVTNNAIGLSSEGVPYYDGAGTFTGLDGITAGFVLTSNGPNVSPAFKTASASGAITTITGNSGGAESPSSGNFNILGTGSVTIAGTANTETVQLTGLTNHAVLVGAGTATITKVGPTATAGQVLQSAGSTADPVFSTATYPSTAGTSGNVLTSDGTNWISSATSGSAFTSINVQTFTSSGTYTPTSGMLYCTIECVGDGGGGGGVPPSSTGTGAMGGGGGGGSYARKTVSAATIGSSQTVTVGTGGAGGANTGTVGSNGTGTFVGTIVVAGGGTGGTQGILNGVSEWTVSNGGPGGTATAGDFLARGSSGTSGFGTGASPIFALGGNGGGSIFGGDTGGPQSVSSTYQAGSNGHVSGCGGTGAISLTSATGETGGNGARGIVIITEYI